MNKEETFLLQENNKNSAHSVPENVSTMNTVDAFYTHSISFFVHE